MITANNIGKVFLLMLFLCHSYSGNSQTSTWYFGEGLSLDFSQTPPAASVGPILTDEGCAVVTNPNGKVIFSTDGSQVYDRQGDLVSNGLNGDYSSTHSALIIPHPANPCKRFFVFTVGSADTISYLDGLQVTEVLLRNNDVVVGKPFKLMDNVTEKLAATDDGNGGYWIVAHDYDTTNGRSASRGRSFYAFHITANTSFTTLFPVRSTDGSRHGGVSPFSKNYWNTVGQMKFNPQGSLLALAIYEERKVEIFHFDKSSGKIKLASSLPNFRTEYPGAQIYGVEFSPSGKKLFVSSGFVHRQDSGYVWGFDLGVMNTTSIYLSRKVIAKKLATDSLKYPFGALSLGPDEKLYIARRDEKFLSSVENPNSLHDPMYKDTAVEFSDYCLLGLPTTIKASDCSFGVDPCALWEFSAGADTSVCLGDSALIGPEPVEGFRYRWETGDTSAQVYAKPGNKYMLHVTDSLGCTKTDTISVKQPLKLSKVELPPDTVHCLGSGLALKVAEPHVEVRWQGRHKDANYVVQEEGTVNIQLTTDCDTLNYSFNVDFEDCSCPMDLPNAFTPNQDGLNDFFEIKPQCELERYHLEIFNRWGEQVYSSNDIHRHWDGRFNSRPATEGVYIYFLTYKGTNDEERYRKGHLNLIR